MHEASAPQRKHHGETVGIMVIYGRALLWAILGTQPVSSKVFGKILTVYHSFQDKRVNVRHSKINGRGCTWSSREWQLQPETSMPTWVRSRNSGRTGACVNRVSCKILLGRTMETFAISPPGREIRHANLSLASSHMEGSSVQKTTGEGASGEKSTLLVRMLR